MYRVYKISSSLTPIEFIKYLTFVDFLHVNKSSSQKNKKTCT